MSERRSNASPGRAALRLNPQHTLFEALSYLLTRGLSCVPVGEVEADTRFLSARTLLQAWRDGLPGETPIARLSLDTTASESGETLGAEALINGLPLRMWLKGRDGRYLIVNRSFAESCGQAMPQAVVGKTDLELFSRSVADTERAEDAQVMQEGQPLSRVDRIDGDGTVWFETYKAPVRSPDGLVPTR